MAIRRPSSGEFRYSADSLSRCDPDAYSNLFDVRKRPVLKSEPHSPSSAYKDSLEISGNHLKKRALEGLKHTAKYKIFQTGFLRIGKYIFTGVAFPPYFLIYGLPKWILTEGLPALTIIFIQAAGKVKSQLQKPFLAIMQKSVQIMRYTQHFSKILTGPIIRLGKEVYHFFQNTRPFLQKMMNNRWERIRANANKWDFKLKRVKKAFQKRAHQIQEKLSSVLPALGSHITEKVNWISRRLHSGISWGIKHLQKMRAGVVRRSTQKWFTLQASKQSAQQAVAWLSKQFIRGKGIGLGIMRPAQSLYRGWLLPLLQKMGLHYKRLKGKFHKFGQWHHRTMQWLHEKQGLLKIFTFQHFSDWLFPAHTRLTGVPLKLREVFKRIVHFPIIKGFLHLIIRALYFILMYSLQAVRIGVRSFYQATNYLSFAFKKTRTYMQEIIKLCLPFVKKGVSSISRKIYQVSYHCLVFAIMLGILGVWGFRSLAETMAAVSLPLRKILKT